MDKETYLIVGAIYLCDGVWFPEKIFEGTYKECTKYYATEYDYFIKDVYKGVRLIKKKNYDKYLDSFNSEEYN